MAATRADCRRSDRLDLNHHQTTLLDATLAKVEPKLLRYRLLHVAARIVSGQRRTFVNISRSWRWAHQLAAAFARLHQIRSPLLA